MIRVFGFASCSKRLIEAELLTETSHATATSLRGGFKLAAINMLSAGESCGCQQWERLITLVVGGDLIIFTSTESNCVCMNDCIDKRHH